MFGHFLIYRGRGRSPRGRGSPRGGGRGVGMRGGRKVIIEPHRHEGYCHPYFTLLVPFYIANILSAEHLLRGIQSFIRFLH